jgi:hypothetical protein
VTVIRNWKKDFTRDYCTAAFIFYAREGGVNKYVKKLIDQINSKQGPTAGIPDPTAAAALNRETAIRDNAAELADLEAVDKTINILQYISAGREIRQAIEFVYFKDCWREMEKGDIEDRVHVAEIQIPASARQVYRWLKKARQIFAQERGLRV